LPTWKPILALRFIHQSFWPTVPEPVIVVVLLYTWTIIVPIPTQNIGFAGGSPLMDREDASWFRPVELKTDDVDCQPELGFVLYYRYGGIVKH
jgi:hypothetical protein